MEIRKLVSGEEVESGLLDTPSDIYDYIKEKEAERTKKNDRMKKYIIALIIILPLAILAYIAVFACVGRESKGIAFFYEKEKDMLYISNGESGLYISKIKILPKEDTLCVVVYKKPGIMTKGVKERATTVWKIEIDKKFNNIKSWEKVIPIESLGEPPIFNHAIIEIHPEKFPCTLR